MRQLSAGADMARLTSGTEGSKRRRKRIRERAGCILGGKKKKGIKGN